MAATDFGLIQLIKSRMVHLPGPLQRYTTRRPVKQKNAVEKPGCATVAHSADLIRAIGFLSMKADPIIAEGHRIREQLDREREDAPLILKDEPPRKP